MNKDDLELLAYGLLGGKGNLGQNLAQAGLLMQQGRRERDQLAQQKQQQEIANQMRQMQLQQAQQQMAEQEKIAGVMGQYARPAQAQQTAPFQADTFPGEAPLQGLQTITQQARPASFDFQGASSALMGLGTPSAFKEGLQLAQYGMKQEPKYEKLNPGDTLYDPKAGKVVYTAQPKQNLSDLIVTGPDGKPVINPLAVEAKKQIAAAGAARVNVDNKQESEFSKAVGKELGAQYTDLMKGDAMAASKINRFKRLESLLPQAGATGRFTPIAKDLASAAQSLGINVDASKLGTQEAVEALSNEMALQLRNPSGGAGMPGAMSDQDRAFLQNMTPGLGKTQEGNRLMIQTAVKLAERDRQVAKLARDYRKKNGRFDEGFYQELAQWSDANPLFGQTMLAPQQAAPQTAPQGGFSIRRLPNG